MPKREESCEHKIDYAKLFDIIEQKGMTKANVSVILGYRDNFLTGKASRGGFLSKDALKRMSILLGINEEDIFLKEPDPVEEKPEADAPAKTDTIQPIVDTQAMVQGLVEGLIDLGFSEKLEDIATQMKLMNATCGTILAEIRDIRQVKEDDSNADTVIGKAKTLLEEMIEESKNGSVRFLDYTAKLRKHSINASNADKAIQAARCGKIEGNDGVIYVEKRA